MIATYNLLDEKDNVVEIVVMGSKQIIAYAKKQNLRFEQCVRTGGLNN